VRPPVGTILSVLIATTALGFAAGCQRASEGPGSSLEREGSRGPHRFRLRSDLRPGRVTLGDPATWKLTAELPRGARAVTFLRDSAGPWMDVSAVREPEPGAEPGGSWELEYRVRAFDLGRLPLPRTALVVAWPEPRPPGAGAADTLDFPADTVTVDSLTTAESTALDPDRGPIRPGLRAVDIAVAAAGVALLLAAIVAAVLFWRARRRSIDVSVPSAAPEPPETPFRRALEALRSEVESLPRDVFYERLSLAIRAYVSAVTGVPALDLTTSEIRRELSARGSWKAEAVRALVRTLDRSDLAKFARHEDPVAEARAALDEASSLPTWFSAAPEPPAGTSEPPSTPRPSPPRPAPPKGGS
jgi:hypothetical protein